MSELRKSAHLFMVNNFEFYKPFISLPFNETVGTGNHSKRVHFSTYEDLKEFLLGDESMYCFSNYLDL